MVLNWAFSVLFCHWKNQFADGKMQNLYFDAYDKDYFLRWTRIILSADYKTFLHHNRLEHPLELISSTSRNDFWVPNKDPNTKNVLP